MASTGLRAQGIDNPAERIRELAAKDPYEARLMARQLQAAYPGDEAVLLELIKLETRHQNLPALREAVRSAMAPRMVKDYGPPEPIWYAVAAAWAGGGDWEDLEGAATEVLKQYGGYNQARHDLVRARVMRGDFSGAVLAMEQFLFPPPAHLQANPGAGVARIPAFLLYLAAGEREAAVRALPMPMPNVSIEALPEAAAVQAWVAPAKERAAPLEDAGRRGRYGSLVPRLPLDEYYTYMQPTHERLWKEVARRYPDCFPAFLYAGVWAGAGGRPAEAAQWVRQAASLQPDWSLPHMLLAGYYHSRNDFWRSGAEAERAAELLGYYQWNNTNPPPRPPEQLLDAKNYLAGAEAAARGKLKEAVTLLASVKGYPYQKAAARLRAAILAARGKEAEARAILATDRQRPPLPGNSFQLGYGNSELFPAPPPYREDGSLDPAKPPGEPLDFRLQLARWYGFLHPARLGGMPDAETHRTADCIEILLRATVRDTKDRTARLWYGLWLLRGDEMWPAGDPRQTDTKRIRDGKKLLEGILKEAPDQQRASEALRRLSEREKPSKQ
jgi:tetratricopeptide (TPR) repeat protein